MVKWITNLHIRGIKEIKQEEYQVGEDKMSKPSWRYSEVVKDLEQAKKYIEEYNIKDYEIVIIWD